MFCCCSSSSLIIILHCHTQAYHCQGKHVILVKSTIVKVTQPSIHCVNMGSDCHQHCSSSHQSPRSAYLCCSLSSHHTTLIGCIIFNISSSFTLLFNSSLLNLCFKPLLYLSSYQSLIGLQGWLIHIQVFA